MKIQTRLAVVVVALCATLSPALADPWLDNYADALKTAKEENKKVLVDFTGSDWCGWCIKIDKDVFSKPGFRTYAKKNLVLVKVDFPERKKLSEAVQKQNNELQKKYGVEGFPTLVLLDSDGKEIGRKVGYVEGGPQGVY